MVNRDGSSRARTQLDAGDRRIAGKPPRRPKDGRTGAGGYVLPIDFRVRAQLGRRLSRLGALQAPVWRTWPSCARPRKRSA
jgi:hypothetical protein